MRIQVVTGDITEQDVDAIVNAANSSLLGGGGVDGAIHRAGGAAVTAACRKLRETELPDGLPAGQAVATVAGRLPVRWIIHTVGPIHSASEDRTALLESAYRQSLLLGAELGVSSIAFPAISAGSYGWPIADSALIAVAIARTTDVPIDVVRFVAFNDAALSAFNTAIGDQG